MLLSDVPLQVKFQQKRPSFDLKEKQVPEQHHEFNSYQTPR